jgi:hypothetical protein
MYNTVYMYIVQECTDFSVFNLGQCPFIVFPNIFEQFSLLACHKQNVEQKASVPLWWLAKPNIFDLS